MFSLYGGHIVHSVWPLLFQYVKSFLECYPL